MDIAKSSLKLFFANFSGALVQFLGIIYFSRELNPTAMGIFFLFEALLGMLGILTDFGFRGAVEKRISEGEESVVGSAMLIKSIPIIIITLFIIITKTYINNYIGSSIALFLAIAIIVQEIAKLTIFVLRGELRVGETAVLKLGREVTWVGTSAIFIRFGFGADGLIYGLLTGLTVVAVWGWLKSSVAIGRPSIDTARSLFGFSKYNVISSLGGYFYSWMDVAILGLFLTQADVGAYEVAWRVTLIVTLLSNSIARTIFPQISHWDSKEAKKQIESTIQRTITPSLVLVIPSFFGVLVFSRDILTFVFGEEYSVAWLVLIILMSEKILQSIHKILGSTLRGIDHPDLAAYATIVSIAVNLFLNIILIINLGIVGAAIATTISFALNTYLHAKFLSNFINILIPYPEIGWLIVSSTGMTIVLLLLQRIISITGIYNLFSIIFTGSLVYFILLSINPSIRSTISGFIYSYL